jgi:hypothetical protein
MCSAHHVQPGDEDRARRRSIEQKRKPTEERIMQNDPTTRERALEPLGALLGEWSLLASFPASAPAALTGPAPLARARFEWILEGRFLLQRVEIAHPDMPDSTAIIGCDARGEGYTQHYFDSRGVARVYAMTLADGVWTLLREKADFTPLDFAQRFTGTLSADGESIAGRWETGDGSRWRHDFELTYTRIA